MQIFQASTDFSSTQGYRNWWYLDGGGAQMVWNSANVRWRKSATEDYPAILGENQHPGPASDAVRRWVAPAAGPVVITGTLKDWAADGGDGVIASIRKNGVVLWSHTLAPNDLTGVPYSVNTTVAAGDQIDFRLNRVSTHTYDWTTFDPRIELDDGGVQPPFVLGPREVIQTPAQRIAAGLQYWPDGLIDARNVSGNYVFYGAQGEQVGQPAHPVRTTGTLTTPYRSPVHQPFTTLQAFNYVAGGPVYRDPQTGMHLMIYHAETYLAGPTVFTVSLGLAKSTDCGNTWQDLGLILQPQDRTQHCDMNGGTFAVNGTDLFVWHKDRDNIGFKYNCVAKAELADVLANARAGLTTQFLKWDGTAFTQPGLGGPAVALMPGNPAGGWFSVTWNTFRQKWVMIGVDVTTQPVSNLFWSESPDGIAWSAREVLATGAATYPSLVGTGPNAKITGQTFYVYYMDKPTNAFDWNVMEFSRRLITLN